MIGAKSLHCVLWWIWFSKEQKNVNDSVRKKQFKDLKKKE